MNFRRIWRLVRKELIDHYMHAIETIPVLLWGVHCGVTRVLVPKCQYIWDSVSHILARSGFVWYLLA